MGAALAVYSRRGFNAGLTLEDLRELVPSLVASIGYSESETGEVVALLRSMELEESRAGGGGNDVPPLR
jgi:hypothetical protein